MASTRGEAGIDCMAPSQAGPLSGLGDASANLWVPIIRSWALTRGFALHPGTRNRYMMRYTRTQHRSASRQVNDHGRVSGTHTHQRDCGASAVSSGPARALKRVHVSGLQVADRQHGRARGASVGCEPDNLAAGIEPASVLLVPVPVKHHRGPGLIDGGLQQRLHGVGLVLEAPGHLPWQPARSRWSPPGDPISRESAQITTGTCSGCWRIVATN